MHLKEKSTAGFTVIEALITVAAAAIMILVLLTAIISARARARDARRLADVRSFASALKLFYKDNNFYPQGTRTILDGTQGLDTTGWNGKPVPPIYMQKTAKSPLPADGNCAASQNAYIYSSLSDETDYSITFCLGQTTDGFGPGTHTVKPGGVR